MKQYKEHFLLDHCTAADYVKATTGFFSPQEELKVEEIGDGNINYVFRVQGMETGKSLVIKQADRLLRSSQRPLDLNRNRIEAKILQWEDILAPGMVPHVYSYDEVMCALVMEDISSYQNLRKEMMAGKMYKDVEKYIAIFLGKTLLPTTDLVLDPTLKKKYVKEFTNPELCAITEDLVLTEPYNDYKKRNIVLPCNQSFVEKFLYENKRLHGHIGWLRYRFMNESQALIHGDLHSGSIFVREDGIKVIDPEFAFYGPMGYDIGNVLGNFILAWGHGLYAGHDATFLEWIKQTIGDMIEETCKQLMAVYDLQVRCSLYREETFKTAYIRQIMIDSLGYAGTEIIRRVVGDTKVMEVESVEDEATRMLMERGLIQVGIMLVENAESLLDREVLVSAIAEQLTHPVEQW